MISNKNHLLQDIKVAHYFSTSDITSRYSNSAIGLAWPTISILIPLIFLSSIWIVILEEEPLRFLSHFVIGYVFWSLISSTLIASSTAFIRSAPTMKITKVRPRLFVMEVLITKLYEYKWTILITIILTIIVNSEILLTPKSMILFLICALSIIFFLYHASIVLAYFGAMYDDTERLLVAVLNMVFFATPIIYYPERLGEFQKILYFNPFFYLIEGLRQPLTNTNPSAIVLTPIIVMTFLIYILSLKLEKLYSAYIAMWVQK